MPARREPRSIGAQPIHLECTSSTIDEARRLARRGAPHGTAVLAERQTAGRGRRGRTWYTLPGKSLAVTVILRDLPDPSHLGMAGMAGALAVVAAAEELLGVQLDTKWPNDVVYARKKLAGTLAEAGEGALFLSIGLNVNGTEADMPPEVRGIAATLQMVIGEAVDRDELCLRVLAELGRVWQQLISAPRRVISRWDSVDITKGALVRVEETAERTIEGRALGIDGSGRLRLEAPDGRTTIIAAGDVEILRGSARSLAEPSRTEPARRRNRRRGA